MLFLLLRRAAALLFALVAVAGACGFRPKHFVKKPGGQNYNPGGEAGANSPCPPGYVLLSTPPGDFPPGDFPPGDFPPGDRAVQQDQGMRFDDAWEKP